MIYLVDQTPGEEAAIEASTRKQVDAIQKVWESSYGHRLEETTKKVYLAVMRTLEETDGAKS